MKAEISIEQLWWNTNILGFFMRQQSIDTLEELVDKCDNKDELFEAIENHYDDVEYLEEDLYSMDIYEFAEVIEYDLSNEGDE